MAETEDSKDEFEDDDSTDTTTMLIEAIKSNPILYSTSHKDYKMLGKKEIIWDEISESLCIEVSWCKSKWKYLRNNYVAKKKSLKGKSGDVAKRIKRWVYFKHLTFLDAEYAHAWSDDSQTTGHVNLKPKNENDVDSDDQDEDPWPVYPPVDYNPSGFINPSKSPARNARMPPKYVPLYDQDEEESVSHYTPMTPSAPSPPSKKRKSSMKDPLDDAWKLSVDLEGQEEKSKEKDSHYYFAMDIAASLRKFPDHTATYAKIKMQQVIYEEQRKLVFPDESTKSNI